LKGAPEPSQTPPLWQRSRYWRSSHYHQSFEDAMGMLDHDMDDMELLGVAPQHSQAPSREDALADALGVRKTPRRTAAEGRTGTANNKTHYHNQLHEQPPSSVNRSEFPRPAKDTAFMEADVSRDGTVAADATLLLNLRPLSNLHPNVAVDCLFEESSESEAASNVFLASNLEGSGLLTVAFVIPREDHGDNPNLLHLVTIEPNVVDSMAATSSSHSTGSLNESLRHSFLAKPMETIPCMAAQPIQSTFVLPCFLPHRTQAKEKDSPRVTDILVLKRKENLQSCLSLQRSRVHVVDCALVSDDKPDNPKPLETIVSIQNAVGENIDVLRQDTDEDELRSIRVSVSLEMLSNALAEKALVAIEAAIFSDKPTKPRIVFALKLRADTCRLARALCLSSDADSQLAENEWLAVSSLLDAVVDAEIFDARASNEMNAKTNNNSAWDSLLASSFHADYCQDNRDSLFLGPEGSNFLSVETVGNKLIEHEGQRRLSSTGSVAIACLASLQQNVVPAIFDSLHLIYEDLKLSANAIIVTQLRQLGTFLAKTCCKCMPAITDSSTLQALLDHYKQDLGEPWFCKVDEEYPRKRTVVVPVDRVTTFQTPPCILSWLDAMIRRKSITSIYATNDISAINSACSTTRAIFRIYNTLFRSDENTLQRSYQVTKVLCEEGFESTGQIHEELAAGIATPLFEALNCCRRHPEQASLAGWTATEYALVGRQDISMNNDGAPVDVCRTQATNSVPVRTTDPDNPAFPDIDKDGIVPLQVSSALLFPADNRIKEAGRLLRSSRPCFLKVPRAVEVSDHEYERLKQSKLLLLCRRSLALPVGRGMLTIGSFHPVAAEPLPLPELCMAGRIPPANTNLALDMTDCHGEFRVWPEFHNGVAAGLRLPLESEIRESISKITRTWIVYNRPNPANDLQQNQTNGQPPVHNSQSHAHGGLLLALGLRGHLSALEMTDIYDYLTQGQVTLTCGVLLGMAANKRGSCDISVSKMLCLHLPSLIPNHFSSIDVHSSVQQAAALGAGLLFQGSSHRMMTEFLLNEIGRRPESDVTLDREAYTLSCGIGLGMVNICKGDNIIDGQQAGGGGEGLADLRIAERLYRYIVGGKDDEEVHRTREANDRLNIPTASASGENERSSCVFEGESINIDVTAAGATLALGLIFLRTGNRNIASAIALPDTHFLLEYVRPDFLSLRVIARALILWEDVVPTRQWIEDQLPQCVRNAYQQMQSKMKSATDYHVMMDLEDHDDSSSMDKEVAPEQRGGSSSSSRGNSGRDQGLQSQTQAQDYDCQAVRQIYVHVLAGACFGLGLRFAGTANKAAAAAISERVVELLSLRDGNDSMSMALRPELQILEVCLGTCAIALAMINAGTGDLESFKLFKILRWRCDEDVKYGTHMSYAMAVGLLFLGGGTCTLGREPEDIAALVAAFFPRFPFSTTDNQYHLQALRHLYALAVKRRDLCLVDVDTGEIASIPVEIKYQNQSWDPTHLTAPCLLPNADGAALEGRILSDRYYPLKFKLDKGVFGRTLFVKKMSDGSAATGDKDSLVLQAGNSPKENLYNNSTLLARNNDLQAFTKYICAHWAQGKSTPAIAFADFAVAPLQECFVDPTYISLPVYLKLQAAIACIETSSSSAPLLAWDFRLMRAYYETSKQEDESDPRAMLNIEKVAFLVELADRAVDRAMRED